MDRATAAEVIAGRTAETAILEPIAAEIRQLSLAVELTYCEPTSNSALRFDLDGPNATGRLTWWSDGSMFVEALRLSDDETIFGQHVEVATPAEASTALLALARKVAGLPSNNSFKGMPLRGTP